MKQAEVEGRKLGKWMREVRIPELEAEYAVMGSDVGLIMSPQERKTLAKGIVIILKYVPHNHPAYSFLKHWVDRLVPEGLD
jgi:hypothetical protein